MKSAIFFFLVFFCLGASVVWSQTDESDSIEWSPARKLRWSDFQAEPIRNSETVASTNTSLGVDFHLRNNVLEFQVRCLFTKSKSWGLVKTDYVLQHEQGHFDIAEIFARKLFKKLGEYKFNSRTYKTDLDKIYNDVIKEKVATQDQYDRETDHSRIREKQMEWLKKIDEMLDEYKAYSHYHQNNP